MVQRMDALDALTRSEAEVIARTDQIAPDHWSTPTVCGEWTVDALVRHLVSGSNMAVTGLTGAPKDVVVETLQAAIDGDLIEAMQASFAAQAAAMGAPGAMEVTVHHPAIDMTGEQLLGFRIVDLVMHAWDLARSLGFDESLDPELVAWTWEWLQPIAPFIGTLGMFGEGPSGTLSDDDPLDRRLIDLTGRRP